MVRPIHPQNMKFESHDSIPASTFDNFYVTNPNHKTLIKVTKNGETVIVETINSTKDTSGAKLTVLNASSDVEWTAASSDTVDYFAGEDGISGVRVRGTTSAAIEVAITQPSLK